MAGRPHDDDLSRLTVFANVLADAAARVTTRAFRHAPDAQDKSKSDDGFDPVTQADIDAERAMRDLITEHFPDHGVDGEEFGVTASKSGWTWTLDPIDGTRSFLCGAPLWTTLIACSFHGRPLIGVIDQPILGERFIGRSGGPTVLKRGAEQQILKARPRERLTDAIIACTDPDTMFDPAELAAFAQVRQTAKLSRYGMDAYAYALLASGRIDLVIEAGLKTYDVAALVPVIEGAGGLVTDWRGQAGVRDSQVVAAGDRRCLDDALVALRRSAR